MFFVTPAVTAGQWHSRCSSCSSNINRTWRPRRPRRRSLGVPGLWQESMGFLAVDTINGLLYHWFMMICRGSSLQLELLDWVAECCRTVVEWFFGGVLYPKWRIDVCKVGICIIQNTICLYIIIYIHVYNYITNISMIWINMHAHAREYNKSNVCHSWSWSFGQARSLWAAPGTPSSGGRSFLPKDDILRCSSWMWSLQVFEPANHRCWSCDICPNMSRLARSC